VSNGSSFSFSRSIPPDQLSPRSSTSSGGASDSESSTSESSHQSGAPSVTSETHDSAPAFTARVRTERIVTHATFVVEELSDFDDTDEERPGVIRPYRIEYAESDRSRSRSRNPPELDQTIMYNLRHLNCSDDSEPSDLDEAEHQEILRRQRAERRHRRLTSGSIGKRTISESIGSDTDREDLKPFLDITEVGSSARRLRRRVGDRRSLQFQDPPPPRIDELEEPNTSDEELMPGESLARELPYYELEYISMEIDSP
jgi:hypothetical protein